MSLFPVLWVIALGLIASFIGSKIFNKSGEGLGLDILLGSLAAIAAARLFGYRLVGYTSFGLVLAAITPFVVLVVYHRVRGTRKRI